MIGDIAGKNVRIFMDTLKKIKKLKMTDCSKAVYYDLDTMEKLAQHHQNRNGKCNITVSGDDSFQAARKIIKTDLSENVLVLNFANSVSQGGGVRIGARAQEEDLCRTSTLYNSLVSEEAYPFYDYNRQHDLNIQGSDTAIYSPNVYIIKDEDYHDIKPVKVSVITMSAPINDNGLNTSKILDQRIYKLLCLAEELKSRNLVLGAWGCGAFGNDAEVVAELFRKNLEKFDCFERVVFAVQRVKRGDENNYRAFEEAFRKRVNNMKLIIVRDNIVDIPADAVVLPANKRLAIGSGASKAIFERAGKSELEKACKRIPGKIHTGSAYPTEAFHLDANYIIHAVVPKWKGGDHNEYEKLCMTYQSVLELCDQMKCETVSIPLLGAGNNGFNKKLAFDIAVETIQKYSPRKDLCQVILVLFEEENVIIAEKEGYEVEEHKESSFYLSYNTKYRNIAQRYIEEGIVAALKWIENPDNQKKVIEKAKEIWNNIAEKLKEGSKAKEE